MHWEALTAIGTAVSALVIAATAYLGLRQLRELQRATQLDGTERLLGEFFTEKQRAARRYVVTALPEKLREKTYRQALLAEFRLNARAVDTDVHAEIIVLDYFERVGAYMSAKLLTNPVIFELIYVFLDRSWPTLSEVIAIAREADNNALMYEKTEHLYAEGRRYAQKRSSV